MFPAEAAPLLKLVPSRQAALYLDVLSVNAEQGFELVRNMSGPVMQADLHRIAKLGVVPIPVWLQQFATGDERVRNAFDHALRAFHSSCLSPYWSSVLTRFHDDVASRTDTMRRLGVARMVDGLSPHLRLRGLTLVSRHPWHRHVQLDGHGLVLVPSAFWTGHPLITWDPQEHSRHVLIYSAQSSLAPSTATDDTLDALLGSTRAAALRALRAPTTTSGLAAGLNTSIATASKHATTLRNAGLVSTKRRGPAVEHRLTQLGRLLLEG